MTSLLHRCWRPSLFIRSSVIRRRCLSSSQATHADGQSMKGFKDRGARLVRNVPTIRPVPHSAAREPFRKATGHQQPKPSPLPEAAAPPENAPGVEIRIDGQDHVFSPILLRDLCACSQCLDPSTKQKYRPTTDIPATIAPRAVAYTDSGVSITWNNDVAGYGTEHSTDISIDVLRDYVSSGTTGIANFTLPPRNLWDASDYAHVPDMSYEEYMESDVALYTILKQLHTHGLAFVTNVPESEKSVSAIAERIGPIKRTFYGDTWDVRSVPDSKNVAYTSQDLGFHMDLLYLEQPPHLQFLHCIRSSAAGGASLFTDSRRAVSDLIESDIDAVNALKSIPVDFHYNHPSSALYHFRRTTFDFYPDTWKGGSRELLRAYTAAKQAEAGGSGGESSVFGAMSGIDHLKSVAWSPPFQAPLGHKTAPNERVHPLVYANAKIARWHAAAQKFNALIHRPEMIYERMMKLGECALFDNRRVLHARKAFEVGDAGKERWLRGTYVDKDPYMSKLRVLKHRFEKVERVPDQEKEPQEYFEAAAAD